MIVTVTNMIPWLKLALPTLLVAVGGTAMIAAGPTESNATASTSGVWIDAPTSAVPLGSGVVTVFAHASSGSAIDELELLVDGKSVDKDTDLQQNDGLAFAELSWEATVGYHTLTVRDAGNPKVVSDGMLVSVIAGAPIPESTNPTEPGSTTTTELEATTTTAPVESTTTLPVKPTTTPESPSPAPNTVLPEQPPSTTPPTNVPTTNTPTTNPLPRPTFAGAAFVGTPLLYAHQCTYSVNIQATINNATSAIVTVQGTDVQVLMSRNSSSFSATIPSGFRASDVGSHVVTVTATGPGGQTLRDVGPLEIRLNCPKD